MLVVCLFLVLKHLKSLESVRQVSLKGFITKESALYLCLSDICIRVSDLGLDSFRTLESSSNVHPSCLFLFWFEFLSNCGWRGRSLAVCYLDLPICQSVCLTQHHNIYSHLLYCSGPRTYPPDSCSPHHWLRALVNWPALFKFYTRFYFHFVIKFCTSITLKTSVVRPHNS